MLPSLVHLKLNLNKAIKHSKSTLIKPKALASDEKFPVSLVVLFLTSKLEVSTVFSVIRLYYLCVILQISSRIAMLIRYHKLRFYKSATEMLRYKLGEHFYRIPVLCGYVHNILAVSL